MSTEIERVGLLADLMLAKKIRWAKVGDLEVELLPPERPAPPESVAVPAGASVTPPPDDGESVMLPAEALCRCSHAMVDHDSSGCLVEGCPVETCAQTKV